MRLRFKSALVTGASSGIGQAITQALLDKNIEVAAVARRSSGIPDGATHWQFDLSNETDLHILQGKIVKSNFDLVINAAGMGQCLSFEEISAEQSRRSWMLMVEAPRRIAVAALSNLLKQKGALVNVSSMAADFPLPYMSLYNCAKAALSAMTQSIIDEYPRLQTIDLKPGDINTGFTENWKEEPGKPWVATMKHMKAMMDEAPKPDVVVKALLNALGSTQSGSMRAGGFLQTVIMPFGARLGPSRIIQSVRRAYLKR
jgi:short-subunit dehydrogenase